MVMEVLNKKFGFNYFLLFFLLISSIIISCEKEAQVKIPETAPKPVLVCFISPEDSLITVNLTNSVPLYTSNSTKYPFYITNATITISDGVLSKNIPFVQDTIGYQLSTKDFPIKAGLTYQLDVKIQDGRVLSAKTTVPITDFPSFDFSIKRNLIDSNEYVVNYEFIYDLSWSDIPSTANYYRGVIYNLYSDSTLLGDTIAQTLNELFESDLGKDGATIKITGQDNFYYFPGTSTPNSSSNYIAYLMLCNKEYFEYHKDLYTNNDVNPFSEAKLNFSNIQGGIGCFSAYRLARKRFYF
jgi:hypothetical protein